ncbi:hypothetical protein ABZX72_35635 [Streptomyces cyaneofuscatus]|uniref:hypothetical protein n=1 Tax=Streptomyces cyaneofuscatus TaxID=66883 RepID=UPI0033A15198
MTVVRAPELAALLVAAGLTGLVTEGGMPLSAGLLVLALAALGALAVSLPYCLPSLVTALRWPGHPTTAPSLTQTRRSAMPYENRPDEDPNDYHPPIFASDDNGMRGATADDFEDYGD